MTDAYTTPPLYAKRLGVKPDKVLAWIRAGELRAINVAKNPNGRPRWRIPLDAIAEWEERRAAKPPVKRVRRRRQKQPAGFIEYF